MTRDENKKSNGIRRLYRTLCLEINTGEYKDSSDRVYFQFTRFSGSFSSREGCPRSLGHGEQTN